MDEQEMKPEPRPAWVVWMMIGTAILIAAAIAAIIFVPGEHGPGRHM